MTEAEWLACADPTPMLEFLWGKATDRKFRLFRCACCRRFWSEMPGTHPRLQGAVQLAERYADGLVPDTEFRAAREEYVCQHPLCKAVSFAIWPTAEDPGQVNRMAFSRLRWLRVTPWSDFRHRQDEARVLLNAETKAQAQLLHDLFGLLPFRSIDLVPGWVTPTVKQLAKAAYEEGHFDRLPILADALEEAGCPNADILTHLRGETAHARGCWAVDLVLGQA